MATRVMDALPAGAAGQVLSASRRRRYGAGEVIFHEGDPADTFHVIDSGRVAILVTSAVGPRLTFTVLGAGESFGELALISPHGVRSATARTLERTETLSIHRAEFQRLRRDCPAVDGVLVSILGQRVERLSRHLLETLYLPVETRIRRRLVDLCRVYGAGQGSTTVPLSQEDLAGLAGAARATVNRVLRQDEALGIVALERRRVTVLDVERLRRRAGEEP